jgi:ion channel-forming bestrophin family protein
MINFPNKNKRGSQKKHSERTQNTSPKNLIFGTFTNKINPQSQHSKKRKKHSHFRTFQEKFKLYTGETLHSKEVTFRLVNTVISAIFPWVMLTCVYGFTVSILHQFGHFSIFRDSKVLPNVVLSLNIVLSLLLVFRTNTAHERFWEGRKLWGAMVNTVRNLSRGILIYIAESEPKDKTAKQAAMRLVVAFSVAMKLHLRRDPVNLELAPLMVSFQYHRLCNTNHPPLEISLWISEYLQTQYERQLLNVFQLNTLHELLDDMVDILGGCERILKTPVPLFYTIVFKTLLLSYLLLLPWELVNGLTWWTGPILGFISFILLGIDEIGSEIEEPFGHDPNDLPLDVICNTMYTNIEDLIKTSSSPKILREASDNAA